MSKRAAKFVPHVLTPRQKENRIFFSEEFIDSFDTHPLDLKYIITMDEAYFHVYDPRTKMENMAWLTKDQEHPQIPRRERSAAKILMIPFFDRRGLIHVEYFENTTITKEILVPLLYRVRRSIRIRRGHAAYTRLYSSRFLLHMDNAGPHRSNFVQQYLDMLDWKQLKHPAYSPDLSPCDFFLFPRLKKKLRGRQFHDTTALRQAIDFELGQIRAEEWEHCYTDWLTRCRKCLAARGRYFEGMKLII